MVLVTGGSGYIGSAVAAYLQTIGMPVISVDQQPPVSGSVGPQVAHVLGDVSDSEFIGSVLKTYRVDSVVHLAGLSIVQDSMQFPSKYIRHNLLGTMGLLDAMRTHSVKRIVFSSSAAVYGDASQNPIPETAVLSPTSAYGLSKVFCEQLLRWHGVTWGLRSISLRYFNAAGGIPEWGVCEQHHPETHLIPSLISCLRADEPFRLMGSDFPTPDGSAIRDFVHIKDIAIAHAEALKGLDSGIQGVFNVGSGEGHSVKEVMTVLQELTGQSSAIEALPRRPGDPSVLVAAIQAIRSTLGWVPQHSYLSNIVQTALATQPPTHNSGNEA